MKRTSMLFALLLALVLVILPAPRAMAAEAVSYDGENVIVTANEEAETLLAQDPSLPQLATPTDLTVGKIYRYDYATDQMIFDDFPGNIMWKAQEPFQGWISIEVHHEDGTLFNGCSHQYSGTDWINEWAECEHAFVCANPDSGTYYFTIQAKGDGINYRDSEIAVSEMFTYVKPSAQLGTCSNLSWNWPEATWTGPNEPNAGGYEVMVLFSATLDENPRPIGGTMWYSFDFYSPEGQWEIHEWDLQNGGTGYYYFQVRTLSRDITVACNGELSELSEPYYYTAADIESELQGIRNNAGSMTDEDIRAAVQAIDPAELQRAMLADHDDADTVYELAKLEEEVGGPAPVVVSDDASAFDGSKVSIVGANLNNPASANQPISLVIDKPEREHVLDANYNNSVAISFSMDLANVENTENLAVPVKISMPIPDSINPQFLVILHYHADGSVEEIWPYLDVNLGQNMATFVLTSFSDFTFTEIAQDEPEDPTADVVRLFGSNRYQTAFKVADLLKQQLGYDQFVNVIVASGQEFPDALAGSYLATMKDAPILLVNPRMCDQVKEYITANLVPGGTVYLLGGTNAVPEEMESGLDGFHIKRLAGANRYETNLAILNEAGTEGMPILVCTGTGFADSLSASATGLPILLVNPRGLLPAQKDFLAASSGDFIIIGGESAVPAAIADALAEYGTIDRRAGANRYETSVVVAQMRFHRPGAAVLAYAQNFPDGLCGGPLAYAMGAPLLLTATNRGPVVAEYAQNEGIRAGIVLGGTGLIDDVTAGKVFFLGENATIPVLE